jgi:ribulose-phosphate 3-epimerase
VSIDRGIRIAPSILSADFAHLGREIAAVERGGADFIHADVMDGHFVPNITIGPPVIRSIRKITTKPLDVHLMIEKPERYIADFVSAGAHLISVHIENAPHLHRTLTLIKNLGAEAGVVLNPSTPVHAIEEVLTEIDFVLLMSVNPGFGGQKFIPQSLDKLRRLRDLLARRRSPVAIEIDGGVDMSNVADIVAAGATILVAGNAIFASSDPNTPPDPEGATRALRAAALGAVTRT